MGAKSNIYLGGLERCCLHRIQTSEVIDTLGAGMSCPQCGNQMVYALPPGMDSPGWCQRDRLPPLVTPKETRPMDSKPGLQTTEFWGKVVMQLVLLINAIFNTDAHVSVEQAAMIAAGMEALYGVSRSFAKGLGGAKTTVNTLATGGGQTLPGASS